MGYGLKAQKTKGKIMNWVKKCHPRVAHVSEHVANVSKIKKKIGQLFTRVGSVSERTLTSDLHVRTSLLTVLRLPSPRFAVSHCQSLLVAALFR